MHYSILLPIWAALAFMLFKIANYVVQQRHHAAKAKELRCQDAPAYPDQGFMGLKHLQLLIEADKKQLFLDLLVDREKVMSERHGRECSTFRTSLMGQTVYFTSDAKNIQAMLATQFDDFYLGPSRRGNMIPTLGDGIFVQDGKQWAHSRAMLRPSFAREQIADLELEEAHVQNLVKVLSVQSDGWTKETNIQTLFFRLTIDSACEFLFGESVDSQLTEAGLGPEGAGEKIKDESAFSLNFDDAQRWLAKRSRLADLYWLIGGSEFRGNNRVVNDFIKYYIDLALQKDLAAEKKIGEGRRQKYVFLEALVEQTRDPVELRAQLLNILLAGRDTTASLLSWLFHELLRNPEIFTKLRATIIQDFGTWEHPKDISFSTLKGCQYLQNTLSEALRLHSVVPVNARRTQMATTLPVGGGSDGRSPIYLPAQTDVIYSINVMHLRKDIWGEDAHEFKPERFAGRRPGWEFLPFNGGPRVCIGQQFALTEASYVIVRLLQRFDELWARPEALEGPVTSNLTLTSCPGRPVTLKLHAAKA